VRTVHFVVPDGIDDPAHPSGGNTYDRRLSAGLTSSGWSVDEHPVSGFWTQPDAEALIALDRVLERIPDGALVLLDGLVASPAPEVLLGHAPRLRLLALVHMPLGHRPAGGDAQSIRARERAALSAAAAVITTSAWSRRRLIELYGLAGDRVHVALPGVASAELASGTATGQALLCVAAVTPDKGHDVLLDSLASVKDLSWRCLCVGSLDRDPAYAAALRQRSVTTGLEHRVVFAGTATGADLDHAYASADVLVLASRAETYGMVVTEALARGLPVIASEVGGVKEALDQAGEQLRPGLLVPPGDTSALATALRTWLGDVELRARLREAARQRRESLRPWSTTSASVAEVLTGVQR
jgi:glycosyltransferase involved in cell wall biosynthesis